LQEDKVPDANGKHPIGFLSLSSFTVVGHLDKQRFMSFKVVTSLGVGKYKTG
jgi:hypothetical protein